MAHCRLLFVGGRDALQKIFDNADDSSSESKAELTIGADSVEDYDWLSEDEGRWRSREIEKRNNQRTIEAIKNYQTILYFILQIVIDNL